MAGIKLDLIATPHDPRRGVVAHPPNVNALAGIEDLDPNALRWVRLVDGEQLGKVPYLYSGSILDLRNVEGRWELCLHVVGIEELHSVI